QEHLGVRRRAARRAAAPGAAVDEHHDRGVRGARAVKVEELELRRAVLDALNAVARAHRIAVRRAALPGLWRIVVPEVLVVGGVELVLGHAVVDDWSAVGRWHLRQRRQRGVKRAHCGGGRAQPQEIAAIDLLCHLLLLTGYLES